MSNFALTSDASSFDIIGAINYALANTNLNPNALTVNQQTGVISVPTVPGVPYSYLYRYLFVVYADNNNGTVGFSTSPTNKTYYGLRNYIDTTYTTNPADYIWYQVSGGFGTTNFLWYLVSSGGTIAFEINPTAPTTYWLVAPTAPTPIDLTVITNVQDISGLVTNGQLNADTVGTTQLQNGSVTNIKIASQAVTTSKIALGAITNSVMAANAVSSTNIVNYSLQTIDFNTSSVTSSVIADYAVTTQKLATGSVTTSVIAPYAVTTAVLNTASVTSNIIASAAVTTAKIAANAVTSATIATGAIATSKIANHAVGTTQLATGSVTTSVIADYAVDTISINTASVTSDKLANQTSVSIGGSIMIYNTASVATTATTVIDAYPVTDYRTARYFMSIEAADNRFESCIVTTLGSASDSFIITSNVLSSNGTLGSFTTTNNLGSIELGFTASTSTAMSLSWQRTTLISIM